MVTFASQFIVQIERDQFKQKKISRCQYFHNQLLEKHDYLSLAKFLILAN